MKYSVEKTISVRMTPGRAAQYLKKNYCNRPIRPTHVAYIRQLIRDGEFDHSHQGIAIDARGHLLDGQHRLTAIVAEGITVTMQLSKYKQVIDDPTSIRSIDIGSAPRSMRDILGISHAEVAVCRCVIDLFDEGVFLDYSRKSSPDKVARVHEALSNAGLFEALPKTNRRGRTSASVRVAVLARWLEAPEGAKADVVNQYSSWVIDDRQQLWPSMESVEKRIAKVLESGHKMPPIQIAMCVYEALNWASSAKRRTRIRTPEAGAVYAAVAEAFRPFESAVRGT